MADLVVGDIVLGRDGATRVIAVQHKSVDTIAEMLTIHTADGDALSITPDHGLFIDGKLVPAAEAEAGATLSTGAIQQISRSQKAIINAVTSDGTIVVDGVLAASNPYWIASLTLDAPIKRSIVNAAIFVAGDVDTMGAGAVGVLGKLVVALAAIVLGTKKFSARKAASA